MQSVFVELHKEDDNDEDSVTHEEEEDAPVSKFSQRLSYTSLDKTDNRFKLLFLFSHSTTDPTKSYSLLSAYLRQWV
jgi:hypothetical protein